MTLKWLMARLECFAKMHASIITNSLIVVLREVSFKVPSNSGRNSSKGELFKALDDGVSPSEKVTAAAEESKNSDTESDCGELRIKLISTIQNGVLNTCVGFVGESI